jgi:predicted acylesterase/phospholipase RssA
MAKIILLTIWIRMPPTFTHLVMSGGGMAALSYFGTLRFLEVEGLYKTIRNVAGTSMGAIFAAAVALQIPLETLEKRTLQWVNNEDSASIPLLDIFQVYRKLGFDNGRRFMEVLQPEIDKITFLDLSKKTGINLVICATHVGTMEATFFSMETTPHVLVADAVRASIAVPWVFEPVRIGDDYYVDGGVSNNIPFEYFPPNTPPEAFLILHTIPQLLATTDIRVPHGQPIAYTVALLNRFLTQMSGTALLESRFPFYIKLDASPLPFLMVNFKNDAISFQVTNEQLDACVAYGYEKAFQMLRKYLTITSNP